ncbi:MAG: hypothetical protein HC912_06510 [Saprospiraceae bacterium]|nr:hypothetical protein [Saprospiraceae bacterium]
MPPIPDQAEDDYVLYRDFLKANDLAQAFELWQKVYAVAPAADGKRNTVYSDGIFFYEFFISQTEDSLKREAYIDAIFELYDQIENCYPQAGSYVDARRAFDYYYKYPNRKSKIEIYELFKKAIDREGLKVNDFAINPFTALLVDLQQEEAIDKAEAKKYEQLIRAIIDNGLKKCEGVYCERWKVINDYAPERLRAFEAIKDFYDCQYYKNQYFKDFELAQTDCDTIRLVFSRLRWGGCPNEDPMMAQVIAAGNKNCVEETTPGAAKQGYDCLRNADYDCAITQFKQAADEATDNTRKAELLLLISKIYYSHLRNFSQARNWALQASEVRPNWGEPYMLIGRLYASSGPLCGPGTGWDSQVVTWVAIDMWNKAKQVDASVAKEANQYIARYTQYMPSIEDIFSRKLQEGGRFFVPCWIQESTTIRAAPKN